MKKLSFRFQYYYMRWICALPCLIIALLLNNVIIRYIQREIMIYILCGIMMVVFMKIYYYFIRKFGWFMGEGYYWAENEKLYIQVDKKIMEIDSVKELLGDVVDIYSNRCASLMIDTGKKKYKIFSEQLDDRKQFREASIYPIYQFIISKFDLKPVEVMNQKTDYWYKMK